MVVNNDEDKAPLANIVLDATLYNDALAASFEEQGIAFTLADTAAQVMALLSQSPFDAVILGSGIAISDLSIDDEMRCDLRILAAYTPNQTLSADMIGLLDGLVPSDPTAFTFQLMQSLMQFQQQRTLEAKISEVEEEISQRKRKMHEIELLKNAIVRNVSHELRTPLLQVKSAVALIGEDDRENNLVNYAQNAVARLETNVKNITMLGHSLDINPTPIILRDAVEYAKRNLTRIWTRSKDEERIHIMMESGLPAIVADKQGLSTVLQLLMDNAIKFGDDKEIEVVGRKSSPDRVYVAVRDSGIGIEEDKLQYIFDSFYQVDGSSTRPFGGAGVGLALVKLILENHHIDIHVDSTLGQGSTFWFELPIATFDD